MLDAQHVAYRYRDYQEQPLTTREIGRVLAQLGMEPHAVLRRNDRAFRESGLSGEESADELVRLMARHPTLLQRPIGIAGDRAVVGRPPERLLELVNFA